MSEKTIKAANNQFQKNKFNDVLFPFKSFYRNDIYDNTP